MTTAQTIGIVYRGDVTLADVFREDGLAGLYDWAELDTWRAVAYDPTRLRYGDEADEAADETNWHAILSDLGIDPADLVRLDSASDGDELDEAIANRCAVVTWFSGSALVIAPDHAGADEVDDLSCRIANYWLLDEDAYSEREHEAWCQYAPDALRDEIRHGELPAWVTDDIADILSDFAAELAPIASGQLHYYNGFEGSYFPAMVDIVGELVGSNNAAVLEEIGAEHFATIARELTLSKLADQ